ncbi:MAG: DUF308 domain-containing protein [Acidobacteria bacterium]|nr:DUF308 domain-containing protein [Acidobacteriota bacterium]
MSAASSAPLLKKSTDWSIAISVVMILAGVVAVASPVAAGVAVSVLVGWLLILSGCAHLGFAWHARATRALIWELMVGLLYLGVGWYLLTRPVAGLASLTLALAMCLFIEAVLEFALGFAIRPLPGSGWLILDGIVTLILAIMIWRAWPSSSEWALGTLVGVSMLFSGVSRLSFSVAARKALG